MTVKTYPADSRLYELAQDYIGVIQAMSRRAGVELTARLEQLRTLSHIAFENALVQHHIEFYDKQDVLDIACELTTYSTESHSKGGE